MTVSVTIGGDTYDALADQATATLYLNAEVLYAAFWATLTADQQGQALVSSYRRLLRLNWIGGALPDTEQNVIDASIILAAQIAQKPATSTGGGTGSNIRAAGAGSARVEFFKPVQGKIFTDDIMALLRPFLAATGSAAAESYGGSDVSIFGNPSDPSGGFA